MIQTMMDLGYNIHFDWFRHDLSDADHKDFSEIHIHTQNILDNRSSVGFSSQTSMTLTGLTKVLEDISDEVYDDLTKIMPWSLVFVVGIVTLLHRSWKIVLISGIPI